MYIIYYTIYSTLYIEVLLRVAKGVEEKLKVCGPVQSMLIEQKKVMQ